MDDAILLLTDTINNFKDIKLKDVDCVTRPSPGKWSKKEIIGHLIDSAQVNLQRFVRCTYEENFKLTYEQDEWVAAQHYQDTEINDLLNLWTLLNKQIIRTLKNYPANRINVCCDNSKFEPNLKTVEWLATDYVEHLKHHLKQIQP